MPKEIKDISLLDEIIKKTKEIRIKRHKDFVKVKFRTNRYLYTIKLTYDEFNAILPKLRELDLEIKEF